MNMMIHISTLHIPIVALHYYNSWCKILFSFQLKGIDACHGCEVITNIKHFPTKYYFLSCCEELLHIKVVVAFQDNSFYQHHTILSRLNLSFLQHTKQFCSVLLPLLSVLSKFVFLSWTSSFILQNMFCTLQASFLLFLKFHFVHSPLFGFLCLHFQALPSHKYTTILPVKSFLNVWTNSVITHILPNIDISLAVKNTLINVEITVMNVCLGFIIQLNTSDTWNLQRCFDSSVTASPVCFSRDL